MTILFFNKQNDSLKDNREIVLDFQSFISARIVTLNTTRRIYNSASHI